MVTKGTYKKKYNFMLVASILSVLASIGSCDLLGSKMQPSVNIETNKYLYDLSRDEFIQPTILNTSDQTIHYSTCLHRELEILENGRLVDTIPYITCRCICPAELAPGEKINTKYTQTSIQYLDENDKFREGDTVTYRLKFLLHADRALGDQALPDDELRSNEFKIVFSAHD
ncbi:MAG: hypothetical protein WD267_05600 [Balneolales bacterium]